MTEYKSFYKTVGGNEGSLCHYPTRLDTYGCGCQHDCKYCYARSLLEFRNLWHPDDPSIADIDKIYRKVAKIEPGSVVRMGGMTDCFMPLERSHGISYETIEALNKRGVHQLIVTKSDLIADDRYVEILDRDLSHIQISITSTDDATAARYEKAASVTRRIEAAEKLQYLGYDVSVRLSPFIPEYVDIDKLNSIEVDKCLVEFLRANAAIMRTFDIDWSPYTLKIGNYRHLPLERKIELLGRLDFKGSVCDDVPDHYHWFRENFNHNPDDCCNLRLKGVSHEE